jgi:hypothetical protein
MKLLLTLLIALSASVGLARDHDLSYAKRQIITESIANYPGVCACPYQSARNGSQCGGRSAYSKPGGYQPKCFEEDVSDEEARRWLRSSR